MVTISDFVSSGAELGTIVAAAIVAYQLLLLKRQQTDEFLSSFNKRYDDIIKNVPLHILLDGHALSGESIKEDSALNDEKIRRAIFDYMQLCEEQLTLLWNRRIVNLDRLKEIRAPSLDSDVKHHSRLRNSGLWLSNREQWESAADEWIQGMRQNFSNPIFRECFKDLRKRMIPRIGSSFHNLALLVESL